jgi:hypothetical protein
MKQYRWRPTDVNSYFPNGERWVYESLSASPGYWKYEGRVCVRCDYVTGAPLYRCEVGDFSTMSEAARAVEKKAKENDLSTLHDS